MSRVYKLEGYNAKFITSLTAAQLSYGASVEKRHIVGDLMHLLNPFGHCQSPPVQSVGAVGDKPSVLKVDMDQVLQADCAHPLSPNYKQTLRRLDVDLRQFM
ncbi:unnamed protein product, partial [Medioppia subpectinata]